MLRWVLRLFTFVLFVLFVAAVPMGVRSYWVAEVFQRRQVGRFGPTLVRDECSFISARGGVGFAGKRSVWTLPDQYLAEEARAMQGKDGWKRDRLSGAGYG